MRLTTKLQAILYFSSLALSTYIWIYLKGPFIDTSFELDLLQRSESFGGYLELVKLDNQPPGQKIFTYCLFMLTNKSMNLTRFFTTLLLGSIIYLAYRWYGNATKAASGNYAFFIFLFIVCVSPVIMSALTIQRYSTSAAVFWCGTILVTIVSIREQKTSLAVTSGVLTSLSFFFSYTSVVLAFIVSIFFLLVDRRQLPAYLIGSIPGFTVSVSWFITAGQAHRDLVLAKGSMPTSRQVGALWENTFWPLFGPASLPSFYFAFLLALVLISLTTFRELLYFESKKELFLLAIQFLVPIFVFSYAGLANANMAGPCMTVLIYIVTRERVSFKRSPITRISLTYLLILPTITSIFTFANFNVLRPYYWSNSSIHVVDDLEALAQEKVPIFYSLADINLETQTFDSQYVRLVNVRKKSEDVAIGSYFIFSDEIDKSRELARFLGELGTQNLQLKLLKEYGRFTQTSSREMLGMYNTHGAQYYLYQVISR